MSLAILMTPCNYSEEKIRRREFEQLTIRVAWITLSAVWCFSDKWPSSSSLMSISMKSFFPSSRLQDSSSRRCSAIQSDTIPSIFFLTIFTAMWPSTSKCSSHVPHHWWLSLPTYEKFAYRFVPFSGDHSQDSVYAEAAQTPFCIHRMIATTGVV